MKFFRFLLLPVCCNAFICCEPVRKWPTTSKGSFSKHHQQFAQKVELEPEPEGGIELTPRTSMAGCRMKQMEEVKNIKNDNPVYKFWMTSEAQGALIKEIRTQILKDASKKANFPGFKKGQVPPYAQPQITQFSVQESIIRTVEASVNSFGLKSLPGSDGEFKVHEDVTELAKGYKTGDSIKFTATMSATYDPEFLAAQTRMMSTNTEANPVIVETTAETIEDPILVETTAETIEDPTLVETTAETTEDPILVETTAVTVAEVESSG